jgi:hypothetical protein
MVKKVDGIKDCLRKFIKFQLILPSFTMNIEFKGNLDPIRGDELNKRVREAAKEALDAIFDSQMPVTTSAVAAANRIQGNENIDNCILSIF